MSPVERVWQAISFEPDDGDIDGVTLVISCLLLLTLLLLCFVMSFVVDLLRMK